MGSLLALAEGMRTLGLFLTLLAATPHAATDQKPVVPEGTIITSAHVTGFDIDRLSPGLRDAIRSLASTPLDQTILDALAARLEGERPNHVAAVRTVLDPGGQARVFFVMGRRDPPDRDGNINDRYIVEEARITGVPDDELTQSLRDDLQALVGKRLDSGDADRLQERLASDLPRYDVSRRIGRGSEIGRIRLVYEASRRELPAWLRFVPLRANALFHSEQGWGSYLDLGIGNEDLRFTPIIAIDNADDLVEEYSGFGLRFETRKLGTRRLGAGLEWSRFDHDWRASTLETLASSPESPLPYDVRSTISPQLKFALTPELSIAGGVSISELEPFFPAAGSQMANAAVASLEFNRSWRVADARHHAEGSFDLRAGSRQLESDLVYTRYLGQGKYRFDFGRHHVQAAGMAGSITGHPPLFERFTLGDSSTLRGWDKYQIAPAGGDRLIYSSIEYRFTGLALFLDIGSIWDDSTERKMRVSTGVGFHAGPAFFVVGFPLNTDNLSAIFTMGLKIPGVGIRW
jgi:hypothetical protein